MRHALSVWLVFAALAVAAASARAETFVICTGEWPPYVSQNLPGSGPLARIISESLQAAGHTAHFQYLPWRRQEMEVQGGMALASFPWAENEGLRAHCFYTDQLCRQRVVFFFNKHTMPGWDFSGFEELKKHKVGGALGYSYQEIFAREGVEADYAPDALKSFQKLVSGRVDVMPESELVGWEIITRNFPEALKDIAASKTALVERPLYLVVSRTYPRGSELLHAFNNGLAILKKSGRYQQIISEAGL